MRIDQINSIYKTYKKQSTTKVQPVTKVGKKDEVELSSVAKDFQSVHKVLSTTPDIREDKVNDIKERMQSGTYTVKAEEVAAKILSHLDLKG